MPVKIKLSRYITASLVIVLLSGCKKFLEIKPPANLVTTGTLFSNDQTAISAINGLYSQMMVANLFFANSGFTVLTGLSADELYRTSPNADFDAFFNNAIAVNNFYNDGATWKRGYEHIYNANAILEGLSNSSGVSLEVRNQLNGEAKFTRAFCYFYLTSLYGDVPLVVSTDYKVNASLKRNASANVYEQIINDLQDAINLMSTDYPSVGKVRPNKYAAMALLARVYLYENKWAEAEAASSAVIASNKYSLSDLNSIFLANSDEAIWQLLPVLSSFNTADGITFIPYSALARPNFVATNFFLNSFEPNDQRKSAWLQASTVGGQTYYYPFKYKVRLGATKIEYNMVLRLAEQYLVRAEARANQNNIAGAEADLNIIRSRAGLPDITTTDQSALLSAIMHERQIEFFAEFGHRWFDLKRTGTINDVLGSEKNGWQPTDSLYPIPTSELQANPGLTQNAGY